MSVLEIDVPLTERGFHAPCSLGKQSRCRLLCQNFIYYTHQLGHFLFYQPVYFSSSL